MSKINEPFLNEKGEICIRIVDEKDHICTVRMDNPFNLNIEQAKNLMKILNGDIEDQKNE